MKGKQKVLLVSYIFPPIGGGGVPRPLKMAKYLAEMGWEVHVLTVDVTYHATKDESLLKELPTNVFIHRAKEWNPVDLLRGTPTVPTGGQTSAPAIAHTQPSGIKKLVKSHVIPWAKRVKNAAMIPDDMIGWLPDAVKLGQKVIAEHEIPIMFSTSGPYTCHLVARSLKRKTNVKWIADFRDPWTQNMHRSGIKLREIWEEMMERSVMIEANAITTVTQRFAENFHQKYPTEIKRMEVIYNGFDPNDYKNIETSPDDGKFTLIYPGIFYKERNPRLFLAAVAELIQENKLNREDLKLQFAGVFDYPGYTDNIDCVKKLQLDDIVEIMGNLPHKKALSAMKSADVLLLIGDTAPGSEAYIPGKLYEYMAIGHPILALSFEGESTGIIRRFELGEVVDPLDKQAIKKAFLSLYEHWRNHKNQPPLPAGKTAQNEELIVYNRQFQAQQLDQLMSELLG